MSASVLCALGEGADRLLDLWEGLAIRVSQRGESVRGTAMPEVVALASRGVYVIGMAAEEHCPASRRY